MRFVSSHAMRFISIFVCIIPTKRKKSKKTNFPNFSQFSNFLRKNSNVNNLSEPEGQKGDGKNDTSDRNCPCPDETVENVQKTSSEKSKPKTLLFTPGNDPRFVLFLFYYNIKYKKGILQISATESNFTLLCIVFRFPSMRTHSRKRSRSLHLV